MLTEEQREELVKMSWENIIKQRDRKGKLDRRGKINEKVSSGRFKPIKQTRLAGGNPSFDMNPRGRMDDLDSVYEDDLSELAEMTREDIMDAVMDRIGRMSKEELIGILERTQGSLEERV